MKGWMYSQESPTAVSVEAKGGYLYVEKDELPYGAFLQSRDDAGQKMLLCEHAGSSKPLKLVCGPHSQKFFANCSILVVSLLSERIISTELPILTGVKIPKTEEAAAFSCPESSAHASLEESTKSDDCDDDILIDEDDEEDDEDNVSAPSSIDESEYLSDD